MQKGPPSNAGSSSERTQALKIMEAVAAIWSLGGDLSEAFYADAVRRVNSFDASLRTLFQHLSVYALRIR